MDYRSLVNKLEAIQAGTYISEATAPTEFKPTHFHKGNLGNKMPLMQTPDGTFWWETSGNRGEGDMGGTRITLWNGDSLNRSGWNPASVDGVITADGKYIDFPEGVNWKQYKETADADAALMEKLKKLVELVDKYLALKAKRGQGARPAVSATQDMGDGSKLTIDPKTGVAASTNDDGTPYVPGSNPNLPKNKVKESVNFKGSIAQSLVESFGYRLDELPGDVPVPSNFGKAPVDSMGNPKTLPGMDRTINPSAFAKAEPATANAVSHIAPAATTGVKTATNVGSKALGATSKLLGRAMPGVGATLGAIDAVDSYKKGDYLGAALNGLSGAFSLVPGVGWIPAVGLAAWQAGREMSGATDKYDNPGSDQPATQSGQPNPPGAGPVDPKVKALQQRILAKDPKALPKYGVDGRMGPETRAAMQRLQIQETIMPQKSLAEEIKELQQKLDKINEAPEGGGADVKPIPPTAEELALQAQAEKIGGSIGKDADGNIIIITKDGQIVSADGELMTKQGDQLVGTGQEAPDPAGTMSESGDSLEEGFWDKIT